MRGSAASQQCNRKSHHLHLHLPRPLQGLGGSSWNSAASPLHLQRRRFHSRNVISQTEGTCRDHLPINWRVEMLHDSTTNLPQEHSRQLLNCVVMARVYDSARHVGTPLPLKIPVSEPRLRKKRGPQHHQLKTHLTVSVREHQYQ